MAIAQIQDSPSQKNCSTDFLFLHIYSNLWLKILKFGGSKKFDNFLTSQKSALIGPANSQLVTYSKIQTKVYRTPQPTPMDLFLIKSVNLSTP